MSTSLSIVVHAHEFDAREQRLFESLSRQTCAGLQIVVVGQPAAIDRLVGSQFISLKALKQTKFVRITETEDWAAVGVREADGDYVSTCARDFLPVAHAFEVLLATANSHDVDMVISGCAPALKIEVDAEQSTHNVAPRASVVPGRFLFQCELKGRVESAFGRGMDFPAIVSRKVLAVSGNSLPIPYFDFTLSRMAIALRAKRIALIHSPLFIKGSDADQQREKGVSPQAANGWIASIGAVRALLEADGEWGHYENEFINAVFKSLFSSILPSIIEDPKRDRRNLALNTIVVALREDRTTWRSFLTYLNSPDREIERRVFGTISINGFNEDILQSLRLINEGDVPVLWMESSVNRQVACGQRPQVTVITITKNLVASGRQLVFQRMLDSIRLQTIGRRHIEHLVIDAKSTDGTLELLQGLLEHGIIDRLISEPDTGVYQAMNRGARFSTGETILFLSSDDYLADEAIEHLYSALNRERADYVFAHAYKIDKAGAKVGSHIADPDMIFFGAPYCHQTLLCSYECFSKVWFDETYKITMWAYALDLYESSLRGVCIDEYLAYFRIGGLSTDVAHRQQLQNEQNRVKVERILPRLPISLEEYECLFVLSRGRAPADVGFSLGSVLAKFRTDADSPFASRFSESSRRLFTRS